MLENRHHNIILDFKGVWVTERWSVYPLSSSESESECNYPRMQSIKHYVNSCNGLLLFFDENGEACICNPTSNESKRIPLPQSTRSPPGFNPYWGCSGLGFDSRSNDYKFIIHADHYFAGGSPSLKRSYVEVYSLKTDSWKSIADFPTAVAFTDPCVYSDGSIYWLAPLGPSVNTFDIADETFSCFDISPSVQGNSYRVQLVDCGGFQLGLVAYKVDFPYCFELWIWAGKAAGWNKRWDFSLPQIFDLSQRYPPLGLTILGFSRQVLYLADANGQVFAYDCAANHLSNLQIRLLKYRLPVFITYVETTASPLDPFLG